MLRSAQTQLMMSDLFRYFLCGHKAVELTAAVEAASRLPRMHSLLVSRRGELIPVDEIKIKTYCKIRALELVGKHVDVQAFKDRVEHSGLVQQTVIVLPAKDADD